MILFLPVVSVGIGPCADLRKGLPFSVQRLLKPCLVLTPLFFRWSERVLRGGEFSLQHLAAGPVAHHRILQLADLLGILFLGLPQSVDSRFLLLPLSLAIGQLLLQLIRGDGRQLAGITSVSLPTKLCRAWHGCTS